MLPGNKDILSVAASIAANQKFDLLKESFNQKQIAFQERCSRLREQRSLLHEQRCVFAQRRLDFLRAVQNRWQESRECTIWWQGLQQRIYLTDNLNQSLKQQQACTQLQTDAFQEQLQLLREQRLAIQEEVDIAQKQQSFQEIEAAYFYLQQQLQERQNVLRNKCTIYRQLRLDYEAQRLLLHTGCNQQQVTATNYPAPH